MVFAEQKLENQRTTNDRLVSVPLCRGPFNAGNVSRDEAIFRQIDGAVRTKLVENLAATAFKPPSTLRILPTVKDYHVLYVLQPIRNDICVDTN